MESKEQKKRRITECPPKLIIERDEEYGDGFTPQPTAAICKTCLFNYRCDVRRDKPKTKRLGGEKHMAKNKLKYEKTKWEEWSTVANVKPPKDAKFYCRKCEQIVGSAEDSTEVWAKKKNGERFFMLFAKCEECGAEVSKVLSYQEVQKMIE